MIKEAQQIIDSVKGIRLSEEERREKAVALTSLMIKAADQEQNNQQKRLQQMFAGMMNDPNGKVFTTALADQTFRSTSNRRNADQLIYLLNRYGIPNFFPAKEQLQLKLLKLLGSSLASFAIPALQKSIRKESMRVVIPGEESEMLQHLKRRHQDGFRVNLNHLGEAIHGEEECQRRLQMYLRDLTKPEVEYISVKISTIFSQINLLAWEETLSVLVDRLKQLFRVAKAHTFIRPDGKEVVKFVNLDMEEYKDLHLTAEAFQRALDDPEFLDYSAGIVLQAYLPDSFEMQKKLTAWAQARQKKGGAQIKLRIVKGANLAAERVESAVRCWPQPPYTTKEEVDANYLRMLHYACHPEHAKAVRIGVGSHNMFDIAYAMLLKAETDSPINFEMLEGMADHLSHVVKELNGDLILYCPAVERKDFENAIAYLTRRLDENTAPHNFLRYIFDIKLGDAGWADQVQRFDQSSKEINKPSTKPRRTQNRNLEPPRPEPSSRFQNEPDTDWSLPQNRQWAEVITKKWVAKSFEDVPVVVAGETHLPSEAFGVGTDPSRPEKTLYRYALMSEEQLEKALTSAQTWSQCAPHDRSEYLEEAAHLFRRYRGDLMGAMIADGGKTIPQADAEISEAIDFIDYYRRMLLEFTTMDGIKWQPKGIVLVTPPWNFPCSIPTGCIVAALAAGNAVLFKPAPETTYVGWMIAKIFWEAGISKKQLQFVPCDEETVGTKMIQDSRVNTILLTGATDTAKHFLKLRPGIDLIAETGGKNSLIVTALADRDLAIKSIVESAFGHSGQKCSALSLLILEQEVYENSAFKRQLADAVASLPVGSAWNLETKVNPLIRDPNETLLRGLQTLEPGEEWLLQPKQLASNLWTPGIKYGVQPGSFTHTTELFGPVLGVMCAKNLDHALELANATRYGLIAGIQTLDEREQKYWIDSMQAGNLYVNRGITGAIVQRQPFGGCKESSFGPGAKAGGPNYLLQLMQADQTALPRKREPADAELLKLGASLEEQQLWQASIESYTHYWNQYFSHDHDPSLVLGQDNFLKYVPQEKMVLRVQEGDKLIDVLRVYAAAKICGVKLQVSSENKLPIPSIRESKETLLSRINAGEVSRIRIIGEVTPEFPCTIIKGPVQAHGRLELLHYLREVSMSIDYHRYGNLGERENEKRAPLPHSSAREENNKWT